MQVNYSTYWHIKITVAWGLATPWRSVDPGLTIDDADNGIVIIDKFRSFDVFEP